MSAIPQGSPDGLRLRFGRDVLEGLSRAQKSIPCLWFYDFRGSELFEEITGLAEYYPTRAETAILRECAQEMARYIGVGATVVEIGSGSSRKTPLLLNALAQPRAYVPVDISEEFLHVSVSSLRELVPGIRFHPVVGDFSIPSDLATVGSTLPQEKPHVGFFPGSTIGNFTPRESADLLSQLGSMLGPRSWMIVGVDSTQDPAILLPAYDDARGVTAQFNLNLLQRINRELEGTFDADGFSHQARFDARHGRIEMHLLSRRSQSARVLGRTFHFGEGESIHTENAYKYTVDQFHEIARAGGWLPIIRWSDTADCFGVFLLQRRD